MASMRILMIFFFAAAALNLTSYLFYWFYPPLPMRARYQHRIHRASFAKKCTSKYSFFTNTKLPYVENSQSPVHGPNNDKIIGNNEIPNNLNLTPPFHEGANGFILLELCIPTQRCGQHNQTSKGTTPTIVDDIGYSEITATARMGFYTYYSLKSKKKTLPLCPEMPPDLGPVLNDPSMDAIKSFDKMYLEVEMGGIYKPTDCTARQRVAIIIPYRGNKKGTNIKHLGTFLYMLHPFLMKQQLEYQVFVVEQANASQAFNHGKLLNAGFTEVHRRRVADNRFHCIIFHEPYLIPVDTRNIYRCSRYPRQLAVLVGNPNKSTHKPKFGGVIAISIEPFIGVNGFSNIYWGNDGDYEDLYTRLSNANYSLDRNSPIFGNYTTLRNFELPVIINSNTARTSSPLNLIDGLTTLSYTVNVYDFKYIFTYINVTLEEDNMMDDFQFGGVMLDKLLNVNSQNT